MMFDPADQRRLEVFQTHQYVSPGEHGVGREELERLYVAGYLIRTDILQEVPVYTLSFQGRCALLPRMKYQGDIVDKRAS